MALPRESPRNTGSQLFNEGGILAVTGPQHRPSFTWLLLLGVLLVAFLFATILGRPREGVPGVTKTVEESRR